MLVRHNFMLIEACCPVSTSVNLPAGDRTVNLLWRLRAEAIPSLSDSVRNAVIQIGKQCSEP